jgi:glycosyltransferase involved in cell wall biosynthesis
MEERLGPSRNRLVRFLASLLLPVRLAGILQGVDVLKTNQMWGAWVPLMAKRLFGQKLIVRFGYEMLRNAWRDRRHSRWNRLKLPFLFLLEWVAYRSADAIISTNGSDTAFVKALFPFAAPKIHQIRNLIDTERFSPASGPRGGGKRVVYVGRLHRRKNLGALIHAAHRAGYALDLVGDGPEMDALKALAQRLGSPAAFLGRIPNERLPEQLRRADVFALPSLYENNPKALLEAMACGLLVVGSDVEGIREIVEDGHNGFLAAPDAEGFAQALGRAWGLGPEERRSMGQRARAWVLAHCAEEVVTAQELELLGAVARGGPRHA